jgi:hypothetical protein
MSSTRHETSFFGFVGAFGEFGDARFLVENHLGGGEGGGGRDLTFREGEVSFGPDGDN